MGPTVVPGLGRRNMLAPFRLHFCAMPLSLPHHHSDVGGAAYHRSIGRSLPCRCILFSLLADLLPSLAYDALLLPITVSMPGRVHLPALPIPLAHSFHCRCHAVAGIQPARGILRYLLPTAPTYLPAPPPYRCSAAACLPPRTPPTTTTTISPTPPSARHSFLHIRVSL